MEWLLSRLVAQAASVKAGGWHGSAWLGVNFARYQPGSSQLIMQLLARQLGVALAAWRIFMRYQRVSWPAGWPISAFYLAVGILAGVALSVGGPRLAGIMAARAKENGGAGAGLRKQENGISLALSAAKTPAFSTTKLAAASAAASWRVAPQQLASSYKWR